MDVDLLLPPNQAIMCTHSPGQSFDYNLRRDLDPEPHQIHDLQKLWDYTFKLLKLGHLLYNDGQIFVSAYYVSGIVLSAGHIALNRIDKHLWL